MSFLLPLLDCWSVLDPAYRSTGQLSPRSKIWTRLYPSRRYLTARAQICSRRSIYSVLRCRSTTRLHRPMLASPTFICLIRNLQMSHHFSQGSALGQQPVVFTQFANNLFGWMSGQCHLHYTYAIFVGSLISKGADLFRMDRTRLKFEKSF